MVNAGRFFVLGFDGETVPQSLKKIYQRHGLAGTILFDRNINNPFQLKALTHELKGLSNQLLISVDQEGGMVQRLKAPHFTEFPRPCEVGPDQAFDIGRQMGNELALMGFNLDYAPLLDVNTNPKNPIIGTRSFGSDPSYVSKVASLFIKGLKENGVMACGKHFPGHGDTDQDSHLSLPTVSHSEERLRSIELAPFKDMIEADIPFLMTAHVLYPALDKDNPATFSQKILDDLLRQELGFKGLVITDDMGMAGALSQADIPDACIQAFAAGCDLLMVCEHHERHEKIIEALANAINKSPALQKRAEQSSGRLNFYPYI